jgi:hypothetical protein
MDVEGDSNGLLENTVMTFIWEEYGNQWGWKKKNCNSR